MLYSFRYNPCTMTLTEPVQKVPQRSSFKKNPQVVYGLWPEIEAFSPLGYCSSDSVNTDDN